MKELRMMDRRRFLGGALAAAGASPLIGGAEIGKPEYTGPNVVLVRFGGGVRRRETIEPATTYAPFLCKTMAKRGTLYKNMMIEQIEGVETSHGQGTLYLLTGKYEKYKDVGEKFLGERFEAKVPTIFEYLRKAYAVPDHQTLIVNGEDRTDEEFYSFSNHHLFGAEFKSNVLSLFRYKAYLLERQIGEGKWDGKELEGKRKELAEMKAKDYRSDGNLNGNPRIQEFWREWRSFYGEHGFVNPRGDRLLTELTLWSMRHLKPKLVMVNYNDPDYVHWGNMSHYTRGITVIDEGLQRLVAAVDADEHYRDNTIFVVVPDCGRDTNPLMAVPCQHHFGSKSSHEIWGLVMGPGIAEGAVVDREVQQADVAGTIGQLMGMETSHVEGGVLEEAIV